MNNIPLKRIDSKAVTAWQLTALIYGLSWFLLPAGAFYYMMEGGEIPEVMVWFLFFLALTLYLGFTLIVPNVRWQRWRYDISEHEIDLLRGFFILNRTVIPINRIQHVDTSQGPIYRRLGLSSVKISTAATTHEIPALDDATAAEVRNKISLLVRKAKEDV